jgi:hypothetical protein
MAYASTVQLPWVMKEYNEGGQSVYRTTITNYVSDSNYTGNTRRIIGLPSLVQLYQGDSATLMAQTEYVYDSPTDLLAHSGQPSQHDSSTNGTAGNYGSNFSYRGNLTKSRRYSVISGSASAPLETKTGYYITGTPAFTKDALDHQTSIFYDDSFLHYTEPSPGTLNSVNRNPNSPTYAYPTKVTSPPDTGYPSGLSSIANYNYDFGAVTRIVDPKAYLANSGNPQTMRVNTYDTKGRPDKALVWKDGTKYSQSRNVYGNDHNYAETWTTVNSLSVETFAVHLLDGASRERVTISEHPGSTGTLKSQYRVFDIMGRVMERSNPTEINGSWAPAGDDSIGYIYSQQAYDWKGRPTVTTNPDATTRQLEYVGCGCAGEDVVISRGERVTDPNAHQNRRTTKTWRDAFGRTSKAQVLNWGTATDTDGSVYLTTSYTYDVLDQVKNTRQQVGESGTYQDTVTEYDGYGRLQSRKRPEESAATVYTYHNDNTLATSTDARGAWAQFTYTARHLVNNITYTSPNTTTIPNTPTSSFQYDELGNRTQMNDGAGTRNYGYDSLGRITSESQYFSELASHSYRYQAGSQNIQSTYQAGYSYNLVGQVQTVTTPMGDTIDYTRDKVGRATKVSGTPRDGVTDYVAGISYRAWGAEKTYSFGYLNYSYSMNYNGRMQATQINDQDKLAATYTYTSDGKLNTVQGINDRRLDRSFSYDHAGRATRTLSATDAGLGSSEPAQLIQDYAYDEFDHMTSRVGKYWYTGDNTFTATFANNIASNVMDSGQAQNWQPDSEGNVTSEGGRTHKFDVAGRKASSVYPGSKSDSFYYDGDGRLASQTYTETFTGQPNGNSIFYLWSSVLKENLAQIRIYGRQYSTDRQDYYRDLFIYVNGQQVAVRKYDQGSVQNQPSLSSKVNWVHHDPLNTMARAGNASGRDLYSIDPLGVQVKVASQSDINGYFGGSPDMNNPPEGFYQDSGGNTGSWGSGAPNPGQWGLGCYIDGIQTSCERAFRTINNGGAQSATLSLYGAVGPATVPIVAGFAAAAISINGQSTIRTRIVPRVVPGEPVVTITSDSGEVWGTLLGPDRVVGYDRVEEVGAISGDLVFGGGQDVNPISPPALKDVISRVKELLSDPKSKCSQIFMKGNGLTTLSSLNGKISFGNAKVSLSNGKSIEMKTNNAFFAVTENGKITISQYSSAYTGIYTAEEGGKEVKKSFYETRSSRYYGYKPVDILAAILIHEVAHVTGDFERETGANTISQSIINTNTVIDACLPKPSR